MTHEEAHLVGPALPHACYDGPYYDRQLCFEMRYYGYSPAWENRDNDGRPEECDCACHDDEWDGDDDE